MQSRNKKISLLQSEETPAESKTGRKPFNKVKKDVKEFNDEDSLLFLKEIPGKNNQNKIDERLEFLRRELKLLVRDKNSDNNLCISNKNDLVNNDLSDLDQIDQIKPEIFKPDCIKSLNNFEKFEESQILEIKNSEPKPLSSKTSEWLSSSIEEIDAKIQAEKEKLSYSYNTPLNSELEMKLIKRFSPCSTKIRFWNLSQQKVEELLYKSFLLQNSEIRLSRSEKSSEHIGSAKKFNHWKCRKFKNQYKKFNTERLVQTDLNKYSKYSHNGRKRELICLNSSENDVEIIIPDSILDSETVKTMTSWVDFDVSNYDWNEPFDLDNDCESQSDVTKKSSEGKDVNVSNQALKQNKAEIMGRNSSEGIQKKSVWECPVCFEQSKGQEIVATQCGHVFCKKCLENHMSKVNQSCPSCRADLRDKPSITLFNF